MTRTCVVALSALVLLFVGFGPAAEPADPGYQLLKSIKIGGEGGWDYVSVDPDMQRLYVSRSDRVQVIDVEKGALVGEVKETKGIHGIALVKKHKKGFTSNGGDNTCTVFDLGTLKETDRIKVGTKPDPILYDSATDRVFTFNAGSKDATAIDADTNKVVGTVELKGQPESAVSDGKGMVYVNLEDKNEVVAFDAKELKVKDRFTLGDNKTPVGMAIDLKKRRLFVTCRNEKMLVLDADKGKILETLPIGKGTDAAAFDPETGLAFSSNRDGTLTIVGPEKDGYKVLANVKTQQGSKTMALDPKTHTVYLPGVKYKTGGGTRPTPEPDTFSILVVGKK